MSRRRQPKMPSRFESTISPSSFTRSIPFRFAKEIWTKMQRNSLSVGRESCLRISRSGSSCICRRHKRQFPTLMRSLQRSPSTFVIDPRIIVLELKELFRVGWRALVIGLTVLSFSVIVGQAVVANLAPRPVGRVIEEIDSLSVLTLVNDNHAFAVHAGRA
jgi:hypothetical protein